MAHCPYKTGRRHPQPPTVTPVLGRGPAPTSPSKHLAGNLGKLLAVICLLLSSRRILLLNSRRQSNHILLSFDSFSHRRFRPATECEPLFRRPVQPRVCGVVGSQMNTRRDVLDRQGGLTPQPHREGQFPWVVLWPADQVLRAPTKPQSFLNRRLAPVADIVRLQYDEVDGYTNTP